MTNEMQKSSSNDGQVQSPPVTAGGKKDNLPRVVLSVLGALFCVCLGIIVVLGRFYLHGKTVIVLEPDASKVSAVAPADLEEAARVLTDRCDQMGCSSVSFVVSEAGQIVGKAPAFANPKVDEALVKRLTVVGLLEFVDFGQTPFAEGATVTTDFGIPPSSQSDEKIWHTVMTGKEFAFVSVERTNLGQYEIAFTLTEQGKTILSQHTSNHIGDYLGIVLDKVVISSPVIQSAIAEGQGVIQGNFTKESATDLAAYLKITPLPVPLVVVENPGQ
jgi:preprotein translocase subunit SecD